LKGDSGRETNRRRGKKNVCLREKKIELGGHLGRRSKEFQRVKGKFHGQSLPKILKVAGGVEDRPVSKRLWASKEALVRNGILLQVSGEQKEERETSEPTTSSLDGNHFSGKTVSG